MRSTVDEWIEQAPEAQRAQLQELRALILAIAPDATEALKWGQPCYLRSTLFAYLRRAKSHVALGFSKGALLRDPDGLLVGNGKQMRHIKFAAGEAIDRALCRALIEEALQLD